MSVPPDRGTRTAGRCAQHPGAAAVGTCEACSRPLCLTCAVPVRGRLFGPECVGAVLGPGTLPEPPTPGPTRNPGFAVAGIAFVGAVAASILPWSNRRSSHGQGIFGGWQASPVSWSLLASVAAAVGLAVWLWLWIRRRRLAGWSRQWPLLAAAGAVAAGALMYLRAPPFSTRPGLGPWVALGAAVIGAVATWWAGFRRVGRAAGTDGRKRPS